MLAQCGRGALRLEWRLNLEIQHPTSNIRHLSSSVGLFQPTAAAEHLLQLIGLQLERLRIVAPVSGVHVAATLTAPLEPARQAMLFDATPVHGVCGVHFAALVERLSSRLGRQSVANVRLRPEAQPELSWHYDPLVEQRRRRRAPKALPHDLPPRPLRLLPRPRSLAAMSVVPDGPPLRFHYAGREQHVAQSWGPERIETGWWRGQAVGRDYFRVETAAGCRYWLFRRLRDGKWFLHGSFD
jgi:protein ImuB